MSAIMDFFTTPLAISLAVVLTILVIVRSHGRAFGDDQKKKRYHPVATTVISSLINFSRLYDHMTEIAHKQKTARSLLLFRTDVYTSDPANVEYILKTNFSNYGREFAHHSLMSDVFGDGIFNVDGERWLHRRKVSSNELSTRVVRDISTAVFKTNAGKLARIIYSESATCHQAIDIQDLFMKASLDSILDILLGIDIDTLCGSNEEGIQFSHAFDQANEITMYRFLDVSWKIKRFLNIGSEAVLRNNIKVIDQFIYKLIKMKTDTIHNSEDELPALKRGDMVSRLLELRDAADPKYLRDLIFSLIIAGKDTTATSLSWFVYLLCRNPHIQEKIVQEVRETTNLKDDFSIDELVDSLTEETLGKLQYLHAALSETLRLYPPVPLSAKSCLSDDTWPDGFSVKKGDMVGYAAYCMGRMKYLWGDDAEEFRPERWLNENGLFQPESPFKFVAFNAGPRICVGKDFAYRQMKMVSAVLLGSYLFKLKDEKRVANYSMKVTLHIKGGLYVQAYPRSGLARP